jgi:hypothetical protein
MPATAIVATDMSTVSARLESIMVRPVVSDGAARAAYEGAPADSLESSSPILRPRVPEVNRPACASRHRDL